MARVRMVVSEIDILFVCELQGNGLVHLYYKHAYVQVAYFGILNARRDELIESKHQETQSIVLLVRVRARHGAGLDQVYPMSFD